MEAIMPEQSSMHSYLNWTRQRIDEMDAALASLESKGAQVQTESKAKADQVIADLKKRREEFNATAKKQAAAGEVALERAQTQLEGQWQGFEGQVKAYFDAVGQQVEQQRATFRNLAAAQTKAWREAADTLQGEALKMAVARRTDADAAIKQMKERAADAEVRLQKFRQAGGESWGAFSAALAESRQAFDRANQEAAAALSRAASPPSA
jgi:hypothetical protein